MAEVLKIFTMKNPKPMLKNNENASVIKSVSPDVNELVLLYFELK